MRRQLWRLPVLLVLGMVLLFAAWPGTTFARLTPHGTPWAWGYNGHGEVGNGSTTDVHTPLQLGSVSAVSIAAGGDHTLALKADGTVLAWGYNASGQLGDGTTTNRTTPVAVSGLTHVIALAAGYYHSLALKSDGTVWAWGYNFDGELGNGTTIDSHIPVKVSGLSGVVEIAGGIAHSLALRSDGTVFSWGYNSAGQLGDGTTTDRLTPVPVVGLSFVIALAGGGYHSLAVTFDGNVWGWGSNFVGQVGDGTTIDRHTAVQVGGLGGVVSVSAGAYFSLALKADGTVWTWGDNSYGQLGDGSTGGRLVPLPVIGLSGVAGATAGHYHVLAFQADGSLYTWGFNATGQLGDGSTTNAPLPEHITSPTGVIAISAGDAFSVALTAPFVPLSLQPNPAQVGPPSAPAQTTVSFDLQANASLAGLGAWTVDVLFNPYALQPTACTSTSKVGSLCNLSYGFNRVRVAGTSQQGVGGQQVLATLSFKVIAPPGTLTLVELSPVTLLDTGFSPLGATLQAVGLSVTALADVNGDGIVDTGDALCVARDVAKLAAFPPACPAGNNGDVNRDKSVTAVDTMCVLMAVDGLPPTKTNACPAFAVAGTPGPGQAPVKGAAADAAAVAAKPRWARIRLTPAQTTVKAGDSVSFDVTAQVPAGLGAWTVDLRYDPKLLTVTGCEPQGTAAACNPAYAPNTIRLTGASLAGETSLTLAKLTFKAVGGAGKTTLLTLQAPTLVDATGGVLIGQLSGATISIHK